MKQNSFIIPNKFIKDNKYNSFELEIISQLCKRKDIAGIWEGNILGLLQYSNISLDTNYSNKKRALQFLASLGAIIKKDYVSIYVNAIFNTNEEEEYCEFLKVDYKIYEHIDDYNLLKYYYYLCLSINYSLTKGNSFEHSLEQIKEETNISINTIMKYNKSLMDKNLIYYVNTGDMFIESKKTFINSFNFYNYNLEDANTSMLKWLEFNKSNYGFKPIINNEDKKTLNSKLKSARAIIQHHGNKPILTNVQYDKLNNAYNVLINNIRVDYKDKEAIQQIKTEALVERYSTTNYPITKKDAIELINGDAKIIDFFNGNIE